ncbi:hypothetical protein CHCC14600_4266 [Bacillus licheniformis]|nr:hypothetical protein CHCC14600_4266 [Bacillus licheniformis]
MGAFLHFLLMVLLRSSKEIHESILKVLSLPYTRFNYSEWFYTKEKKKLLTRLKRPKNTMIKLIIL